MDGTIPLLYVACRLFIVGVFWKHLSDFATRLNMPICQASALSSDVFGGSILAHQQSF